MTYEKMRFGLLICFAGVVLTLFFLKPFVSISTIFLALVLGLVFALPVSVLVLMLIGGASQIIRNKKHRRQRNEKLVF